MRLAWFSPMPPVRSGVATCSAELVQALGSEHQIDVYVHAAEPAQLEHPRARSAHDFVWRNRLQPYDLTVFQLGNSSHHDFMWPYVFRYPGLAVLHDAHLHHARAASLLRNKRPDDYRAEFVAAHPGVSADLAELAVAGFDNVLYYEFPMTRLVVEVSRLTAVHARGTAKALRETNPSAAIETIRLGHGILVTPDAAAEARARVRGRYAIDANAVVFGVAGGLTPEKRLPQILDALQYVRAYVPSAHLLLAGASASHYDLAADVRARGLDAHVTISGYLAGDDDLTAHLAACDVSLNLRWPTAREMSGPWLRALAAGRPTIVIDLAHMADVPSLDPRTWTMNEAGPHVDGDPVTVAVDIVDEDHSLRLAMRRLATDADLRSRLGRAAQRYWQQEHSLEAMADDYRRAIPAAAARPAPRVALPPHLVNDGAGLLRALAQEIGLDPAADLPGVLG